MEYLLRRFVLFIPEVAPGRNRAHAVARTIFQISSLHWRPIVEATPQAALTCSPVNMGDSLEKITHCRRHPRQNVLAQRSSHCKAPSAARGISADSYTCKVAEVDVPERNETCCRWLPGVESRENYIFPDDKG
jgi:hypothetical protein